MSIRKPDIPANPLAPEAIHIAVRGRDPKISQTTALYLLAERPDIENRHLDFQAVLEDAHAPKAVRCFAAMHLGAIATPEGGPAALTRMRAVRFSVRLVNTST